MRSLSKGAIHRSTLTPTAGFRGVFDCVPRQSQSTLCWIVGARPIHRLAIEPNENEIELAASEINKGGGEKGDGKTRTKEAAPLCLDRLLGCTLVLLSSRCNLGLLRRERLRGES